MNLEGLQLGRVKFQSGKFDTGTLPSRERYVNQSFDEVSLGQHLRTLDAVTSVSGETASDVSQVARAAVPVAKASSLLKSVLPLFGKISQVVPFYPKLAIMAGAAAEFLMEKTPRGFTKAVSTAAIGLGSWKLTTLAITKVYAGTLAMGFPPIAIGACTLGVVTLGAMAGYALWQGTLKGVDKAFPR